MPFKTIVAIIQSERDVARVLDVAIPFAERHESHLIGVHAEALAMPYTTAVGFPDTEFIQANSELCKERAEKIQKAFLNRIETSGVSFEWRSFESFSGDSALSGVDSARCADLVIVSQAAPDAKDSLAADIDSLIYEAGRPVLVVPHSAPLISTFRHILIAWNGSREAARAAFDALPFIIEAEQTEILVVDPVETASQSSDAAGAEIAAAFARHGAKVSVSVQDSRGHTVDAVIHQKIVETGADLLVMGAYSHSWLREFLFGGVTRSVLQAGDVAILLSR
ncbi:MAG: universal stress protein [Proteobacteria bacterium]|jgi:nucleotide-binding universal stress UspA family protein|uniref:universal stress protein n=1 Tax=Hyphomicrobiales TaxID=356 RepID=UPI000380F8E5|nr:MULTISPECIES: universal stress protein [Phyllobacteriaceae]MCA0277523.1 universal stress protein [Pseudomonadota bacterium]MCX8568136.1 universal stress protein [Aminobacter sp. MET-1]